MKPLLIALLMSAVGCASVDPIAKEISTDEQQPAKHLNILSVGPKGEQTKLATVTLATGEIELEKGVKMDQVMLVMLQSYQNQSNFYNQRYSDLADLCIGRGKKVPDLKAKAKK